MSLINDMLRDLDRRQGGSGRLPNEVRPLPPESGRPRWLLLAVLAVVILALAGWLHLAGWPSMAPVPDAPRAATATIPPAAPAARQTPPAAPPAAEPVLQERAHAPEAPLALDGLRMDASLSRLPAPPPAAPARKAPEAAKKEPTPSLPAVAAKAGEPSAASAGATRPAAPAQTPAAEPPAAAGGIEKRPRNETPRERAEQDYRKAYALLGQGRTNEALPLLRNTLAEDATHVSARLALAGVLAQSARPDEALALIEEGLQLEPTRPALALAAARLHAARGAYDRAEQILSRAAPSAQADAEFRAFHAAVLQRLTLHKE
ncbi:MAG: tetratricopeptide repeat protein, partial [Caenispirillum sp.]|nr:tetratricopeptide repeat protein [Caenispirillum sp.]